MKKLIALCSMLAVYLVNIHVLAVENETQIFASGKERVPLVELYTSEGCSSCPPADRWMSGLTSDAELWTRYVPVSFHVDYWDYIGWPDRFAAPENGQRQKRHAAAGGARTVYTPGMFVDGEEWLEWRRAGKPQPDGDIAGDLRLEVNGGNAIVRFEPADRFVGNLIVNVAILGMGLSTEVRRGENSGRLLNHDFVSLGVARSELQQSGQTYTTTLTLPEARVPAPQHAVVAWVSVPGSAVPLQSVGGLLQ